MPRKRKPKREKRIRVRSKRLDQLDESKLALAFWLLAQQVIAEDDESAAEPTPRKPRPQ
jgi:hypothetical protein